MSRLGFARSLSLGEYRASLESAVIGLKFSALTRIATPLGRSLARHGMQRDFFTRDTVLVPVPLPWWRRRQRGYNQAELIANEIASETGLPVRAEWLRRVRYTVPQAELTARQRRRNVAGAFAAGAHSSLPRVRVVVVDDVMTTGATVQACALPLLRAGVVEVDTCTVARVT